MNFIFKAFKIHTPVHAPPDDGYFVHCNGIGLQFVPAVDLLKSGR